MKSIQFFIESRIKLICRASPTIRGKATHSIVRPTRREQTTIPLEFRKKYGIKEEDEPMVKAFEGGLFEVIPKLEELAGVDAQFGNPEEIKKQIETLREEY